MALSADNKLEVLEARIDYRFRDRSLLVQALTHGSAKSTERKSNERLEFLGDAILDLVISAILFEDHPDLDEGWMTKVRAQTVSRRSLYTVARSLNLRDCMIVGRMFEHPSQLSDSILADAVEAIIAAVYVDGGIDAARAFCVREFRVTLDEALRAPGTTDYKSLLGQWAQRVHQRYPRYRVLSINGPDHELVFEVSVRVGDQDLATASGSSKKVAEQRAARIALESIGDS
ncbi:MAG: ribonuclease III [Planctomycetes bacterium]|nr:ribonuclease III [Planctomycetota bacterium]